MKFGVFLNIGQAQNGIIAGISLVKLNVADSDSLEEAQRIINESNLPENRTYLIIPFHTYTKPNN